MGAVRVNLAGARFEIKIAADDPGVEDFVGVFVFEFEKAAPAAAIAQGFPFIRSHLFEGFGFPEPWVDNRHNKSIVQFGGFWGLQKVFSQEEVV